MAPTSNNSSVIDFSQYLTFINSLVVDWSQGREGGGSVAVVQLTPLGASAPWCTKIKTWSDSLIFSDVAGLLADGISRRTIVCCLVLNAKKINDKLLQSLRALDWETRRTARNAFRPTGQRNEWFHDIIQTLLVDRLIWAYLRPANQDMRSFQVTHVKAQPFTPKLEVFHNLFTEWRRTLSKFVELWKSNQSGSSTQPPNNRSSLAPKEDQVRIVLETLYAGGVQESELAKVENNFCRAALGLIALQLVCFLLLDEW